MSYQLRNGLSYCEVDGRLVFLDLEQDRYFQLPDTLSHAFRGVIGDRRQPTEHADVEALLARNILVASTVPTSRPVPCQRVVSPPDRSALELPERARVSAPVVLEVGILVASARLELRARRLGRLLDSVVERRDRSAGSAPADGTAATMGPVLEASALFHRARAYVPFEPGCLLDSIALVRFLSRRHLRADIVLGVTLDPFAAHCWVQAGAWVLNDSVGNAMAHTPIRRL